MNRGVLAGLGPGDSPDVLTSDAGQNAVLVAGNRKEVTFTVNANTAVATTDCANYRWVSVQFVSFSWSGSVVFQGSNDNLTWTTIPLNQVNVSTPPAAALTAASGAGIWSGPLPFRYFRLLGSGGGSGTAPGVIEFFAQPTINFVDTELPAAAQPQDAVNGPTAPAVYGYTMVYNPQALAWDRLRLPNGDAQGTGLPGSAGMVYNGASWDRLRVPTVVKTATATASGDTALWTPTSGKKFRLQRYMIEVTGNAATSGGAVVDVVLRDATTATAVAMSPYVPASGGTALGGYSTGWVDLGNGILSAAANNVLNINLSAALTAGKVRVVAAGTEE